MQEHLALGEQSTAQQWWQMEHLMTDCVWPRGVLWLLYVLLWSNWKTIHKMGWHRVAIHFARWKLCTITREFFTFLSFEWRKYIDSICWWLELALCRYNQQVPLKELKLNVTDLDPQFRKELGSESCYSSLYLQFLSILHRAEPRKHLVCESKTMRGSKILSPDKMPGNKEIRLLHHGLAHLLTFGRKWFLPAID